MSRSAAVRTRLAPPIALLLALLAAGCLGPGATTTTNTPGDAAASAAPVLGGPIGHVFVIVLENKGYEATFGATPGSVYLGKELPARGHLLTQYYGIGHASLGNYIAMVSGQAPNPMTQTDCEVFADYRGASGGPDGQAVGQGCVYPKDVRTIGDQLASRALAWRVYAEDMAASPGDAPTSCRHPPIDSQDPWEGARAKDQYATKHVPFVYFHSIIDDEAACKQHVVDLSLLDADLNDSSATPALAYIVPDLCSDGHDATCPDGAPGGYAGIDKFLRTWVPRIENSTAFQQGGMIVITFDEAETDDAGSCCGEEPGFGTLLPGTTGQGGGRIGALLLSNCHAPGTTSAEPANHYSLLRTWEDLWHVEHLGYAGAAGLKPIDLGACK